MTDGVVVFRLSENAPIQIIVAVDGEWIAGAGRRSHAAGLQQTPQRDEKMADVHV